MRRFHFSQIDSTNNWAKENIAQWAKYEMAVVTAEEQTGGRGRFKRRWESPRGVNIYATFCFLVDQRRPDIGQIPQLLAFSAGQVLEAYQFSPTFKWPNDLLISGKKMGGILCETLMEESLLGIVCGIGLNINMEQAWIDQIDQPATSLFLEKGQKYDVEAILNQLIELFANHLQLFFKAGFAPFFSDFKSRMQHRTGQNLSVQDGSRVWTGEYVGLNEDGSISIKLSDGTTKICSSGEIPIGQ